MIQQHPNQRIIVDALDFSKAFDTVNRAQLFLDIMGTPLPNDIQRWLPNYLNGR